MKVDFFNAATIELHSPEEVPAYDSVVMPFNTSDEIAFIYKATETL